MSCEQAFGDLDRVYPASYPAAAPPPSFLRPKLEPPPAPRRRPASTSWVVPPLTLPVVRPIGKRSRAGSSTVLEGDSGCGGRIRSDSDALTECEHEAAGEEDEEPGVFKLDGDGRSHSASGEATPDLASDGEHCERSSDDGQCSLRLFGLDPAAELESPCRGFKHAVNTIGLYDDAGGGTALGKGKGCSAFSPGSPGFELGTSPILQLALKQLAGQALRLDEGALVGRSHDVSAVIGMLRQTTI